MYTNAYNLRLDRVNHISQVQNERLDLMGSKHEGLGKRQMWVFYMDKIALRHIQCVMLTAQIGKPMDFKLPCQYIP